MWCPSRRRPYPVIDDDARLVGALPWSAILEGKDQRTVRVRDAMITSPSVAPPDEVLRSVADRMAALGLGALPVVDPSHPQRLEGLITQFDLLEARQKLLEEERRAERILTLCKITASKDDEPESPQYGAASTPASAPSPGTSLVPPEPINFIEPIWPLVTDCRRKRSR